MPHRPHRKLLCPLCAKEVSEPLRQLEDTLRDRLVDLLKQKYPRWVQEDGACALCQNYYLNLLRHTQVEETLRQKALSVHQSERHARPT